MTEENLAYQSGEVDLEDLLKGGFRYALSLSNDESRAENVLQDAWLSIFQSNGPRHIGYLFFTLRNRFIDLRRGEMLVVKEPLDITGENREAQEGREGKDFYVIDKIHLEKALFLHEVEERTIAEITGWPKGTISNLIQRGRRKIRIFLQQTDNQRAGREKWA